MSLWVSVELILRGGHWKPWKPSHQICVTHHAVIIDDVTSEPALPPPHHHRHQVGYKKKRRWRKK